MEFKLTYFGDGIEKTRYHTRKDKERSQWQWWEAVWGNGEKTLTDLRIHYIDERGRKPLRSSWYIGKCLHDHYHHRCLLLLTHILLLAKEMRGRSHLLASLLEGSFESEETNFSLFSLSLSLLSQTHIPATRGKERDSIMIIISSSIRCGFIPFLFCSFSWKYSSCLCPNQHEVMPSGALHTSQCLSNRIVILVPYSPLIQMSEIRGAELSSLLLMVSIKPLTSVKHPLGDSDYLKKGMGVICELSCLPMLLPKWIMMVFHHCHADGSSFFSRLLSHFN